MSIIWYRRANRHNLGRNKRRNRKTKRTKNNTSLLSSLLHNIKIIGKNSVL